MKSVPLLAMPLKVSPAFCEAVKPLPALVKRLSKAVSLKALSPSVKNFLKSVPVASVVAKGLYDSGVAILSKYLFKL